MILDDSPLNTSQAIKRVTFVLVLAIIGMGVCIAPSIFKYYEIHNQTVRFDVPVISKHLDYDNCTFFNVDGTKINPDKSIPWDGRNAYRIIYQGQDLTVYNDQTVADQLQEKYCKAQPHKMPQISYDGKLQTLSFNKRILLSDGRVFMCGANVCDTDGNLTYLADTWLLDAKGPKLTPGPKLQHVRNTPAAIRLSDGRVLISGGDVDPKYNHKAATLEIFDPSTNQIHTLCSVRLPRIFHQIVEMRDGQVLILGGMSDDINKHTSDNMTPLVELVDVAQKTSKIVGQLDKPRINFLVFKMSPDTLLLLGTSVAQSVRHSDERDDLVDILTMPTP